MDEHTHIEEAERYRLGGRKGSRSHNCLLFRKAAAVVCSSVKENSSGASLWSHSLYGPPSDDYC